MRPALLRAPSAQPSRYEHRRPEQTPLYRLVQQHYETFAASVAGLPQFVKDEFEAFLECGILAHGFMRLRCEGCTRELLVAFSCKLRGICPSCGTRRMAESAAYLVDQVIPHVPLPTAQIRVNLTEFESSEDRRTRDARGPLVC